MICNKLHRNYGNYTLSWGWGMALLGPNCCTLHKETWSEPPKKEKYRSLNDKLESSWSLQKEWIHCSFSKILLVIFVILLQCLLIFKVILYLISSYLFKKWLSGMLNFHYPLSYLLLLIYFWNFAGYSINLNYGPILEFTYKRTFHA